MSLDMENNSTLTNEQAETFAYNIFRDIGEYIKENSTEFLFWVRDEILGDSIENMVLVLDEGIVKRKSSYDYRTEASNCM